MLLTEAHIIKKDNCMFNALDEAAYKSKNLYNATLYTIRQKFFENETVLTYETLQKQFQNTKQADYVALPTKVSQWTMKMVCQNFKAFKRATEEYKKEPSKFTAEPKIPKYLDKFCGRYLLTYTNQAISKKAYNTEHVIRLSGIEGVFVKTKVAWSDIQQVRVVKGFNQYTIEVVYYKEEETILEDNGRYCGIDLGVSNFAAVATNVGTTPFIVSGKEAKSYNRYFNKELAKLRSILEVRNGKKSSNGIGKLCNKRNRKMSDFMHKASRMIVNHLVSNDIHTLIVGKNDGWKQGSNIGETNNQNFVQLPHARFIDILTYKCALYGIRCVTINENHTSKCSFLDGESVCHHKKYVGRRKKRGLFVSSNGRKINADVNAAYNMIMKCMPNAEFADGVEGVVVTPVIIKITNEKC